MTSKTAVEVTTSDFLNIHWVCPTCKTVNSRDAMPHKGSPSAKCRYCLQRLTRDSNSGKWSTENYVIREGKGYKEVSVEGHTPVGVNCKETHRVEGYKFECPACHSQNEAALGKNPQGPFEELITKDHRRLHGVFLKCHHCALVIQQSQDSEWEIIQEGRDL